MNATLKTVRPDPAEGHPAQPVYMIDNRGNLIIEHDSHRIAFNPSAALDLIAFMERTGYQAHAKGLSNGSAK
jgi:hypothetical protein